MTNTKHTPGPWDWNINNGLAEINAETGNEISSVLYKVVFGDGDTLANARLIAAAPELLAACEGALVGLVDAVSNNTLRDLPARIAACKKAIRAAKGNG